MEELSVLASDHRYKKPRTIPRPQENKPKVKTAEGHEMNADAVQKGVAMLFNTRRK